MLYFLNDYSEGAHPLVMEKLCETNLTPVPGYGDDPYCASAKEKIRAALGLPDADVAFLVGGTQANLVVISALLQRWEAVIAAESGHIAVHEAGAVEFTGHKVVAMPQHDGKLDAGELDAYMNRFEADETHSHMCFPAMVYISYPTELGTLYTKDELTAIWETCRKHGLKLYIDGARLGYGLMSEKADLTFREIADLCNVFYIGGTKVGALCGEAVVFPKGDMPVRFFTMMKQQGAVLAKGRLAGIQFDVLFTDGLYFSISRHAIQMAQELKRVFRENGFPLYVDSPTNQQFFILTPAQKEALAKEAAFEVWDPIDESHIACRFVTSWATQPETIRALEQLMKSL